MRSGLGFLLGRGRVDTGFRRRQALDQGVQRVTADFEACPPVLHASWLALGCLRNQQGLDDGGAALPRQKAARQSNCSAGFLGAAVAGGSSRGGCAVSGTSSAPPPPLVAALAPLGLGRRVVFSASLLGSRASTADLTSALVVLRPALAARSTASFQARAWVSRSSRRESSRACRSLSIGTLVRIPSACMYCCARRSVKPHREEQ